MPTDEQLQRVLDELEIRNLLARVHNCVDALRRGEIDYETYEANWTADSVWESEVFGTFIGVEGHRQRHGQYTPEAMSGSGFSESLHMTLSTEVRLDGNEATCESRFLYGVSRKGDADLQRMGRYRDRVVRTPAGWRMQHRTVYA